MIVRVTSVLPFDADAIPPDVLDFASRRGTLVHSATELIDKETLNWDTLDERLVPYCRAWQRFVAETGWISEATELEVENERHGYAGRLDRFGRFTSIASNRRKRDTVLDIKTGSVVPPTTGLQLAAYAEGVPGIIRKNRGEILRVSVQLLPTGAYRLQFWDDPEDFRTFLAFLAVRRWEIKHGLYEGEKR
jgi:hypothetical protein